MARAAALAAQQAESMPAGTVPLSAQQKLKLIRFIRSTPTPESIYDLADFTLDASTPPSLVLAAGEAIWSIGLPQDPHPNQGADLPALPITAAKLRDQLVQIDADKWRTDERPRLEALLAKLNHRIEHGLDGNTYRLGSIEVRPGDWLLMRNPSPYNLFTDLAPGLFTHVGVVALETSSDGKRRMVVVDLPERGSSMPATNVEVFLDRTLNYVFLRHPDDAVAKKMADAATSMVGNPTQFDLNFRTDRVTALAGKPLHGQLIHTYCAGLLLLCAQETGLPREQFFPITETTAPGHTKENMAKLGLSLGEGFVSPTGAIFSPRLEIVGRSEPMYDPPREIEEAIFDYFATRLDDSQLQPTSDVFQLMRLKVAEASKTNPLLARALAASANVSEQMDLVSAAKAAVVVETLDEVAFGSSAEFNAARRAITDGAADPEADAKRTPEERDAINKYRTRHADQAARWDAGQISPRALRVELVKFYTDQGRREIDRRIFGGN
jgi:hypothetical protein